MPTELERATEARDHKMSFLLWRRQWDEFVPSVALAWEEHHFDERELPKIPEYHGIYAFCIKPVLATNLSTSYLIYIGETTRPMRERYREYLREKRDPLGRARVYAFFNKYQAHISFFCSPLPSGVSTRKVESELLAAYTPPLNSKFPASIARVVKMASV